MIKTLFAAVILAIGVAGAPAMAEAAMMHHRHHHMMHHHHHMMHHHHHMMRHHHHKM